ncbi:hypothetical protein [Pseudarthrobacter sp. NPDC058119]|uniref:hypothetical protein n=1 Tax=Pseudarthrobacter sp. NPDC058119 TaxID=3346348 RepID=UPI0036DEACB4
MGHEPLGDLTERVAAQKARDERVDKVFGSWASVIAAVLVMAPSIYRLSSGPVQWYDVVSVIVGTGLIGFHAVRLLRLRRTAADAQTRRANS